KEPMKTIIQPLPIIITLITAAGILMHEMHIDRASTVAVTAAAAVAGVATVAASESLISNNYHTHVDRASMPRINGAFRSSLPNIQPPRDDDRKYIQSKKLLFMGGGDAATLWPSV